MSFKQKLAEFLKRSKHFKNISFVKKFIEKNIAISNNEKITDVPIQNTATQLYKVDSQQIHYIAKSQKTVPTQEQNKEQNER